MLPELLPAGVVVARARGAGAGVRPALTSNCCGERSRGGASVLSPCAIPMRCELADAAVDPCAAVWNGL